VSGFSADWLALREPLDFAARDAGLAQRFAQAVRAACAAAVTPAGVRTSTPAATRSTAAPLRLVDLAAGTGANFRALAPVLGGDQDWLLVDHDPALLGAQAAGIQRWAAAAAWAFETSADGFAVRAGSGLWRVRPCGLDLERAFEQIDFVAVDGVTTTAFLDLVSAAWLDRLCAALARARRPLLATLTVDGYRQWQPGDAEDARVLSAFARHQGGDKGFGAALGERAVDALVERLVARGFRVSSARSDWRIGASASPGLLRQLVDEAARVAGETEPLSAARFADWAARRQRLIADGTLTLTVGHRDLLAEPAP